MFRKDLDITGKITSYLLGNHSLENILQNISESNKTNIVIDKKKFAAFLESQIDQEKELESLRYYQRMNELRNQIRQNTF